MKTKLVLPVFLSTSLVVGFRTHFIFRIQKENTELAGLISAQAIAKQIKVVRTFYTTEVVIRAQKAGMVINYDYREHDTTLPLPATLVKALGSEIQKAYPGTNVRLYSRHPFPHRKATEAYDSFELEAITSLEQNPEEPFYKLEVLNGRNSIRYAVADRMRPACINCHNTHPESPKTDWNKGDVRGVVEVIVPVDIAETILYSGTVNLAVLIGGGLIIIVLLSYWVTHSTTRSIKKAVGLIAVALQRIARSVNNQEISVKDQSYFVRETSSRMEELGGASQRSSEQAQSALTAATEVSTVAQDGLQKVTKTLESMASLEETIGGVEQRIRRLSEHIGQIGDITELVRDLAKKTHILALNTGVEAARAGEQGRVFSLIAAEIRELASESRNSADKIRGLVEDIQAASNDTRAATEEGALLTQVLARDAQSTGTAFQDVVDFVSKAVENAHQISLNAKQQAEAVEQVVASSKELSAGFEETASEISNSRQGVEELNEATSNLNAIL
jgi:methyl-accepting chemotaxis protein